MSRGGRPKDRDADRDGPERRCLVTGEGGPKAGLIRFVVGPEGQVVPDVAGKLPGRGFYVTASRAALTRAAAKRLFARGAKRPVTLPFEGPDGGGEALADEVERQVARRLVDLISLARRAGDAVAGYERVKDWLSGERAEVLIQASDGSGRGKSKLSTPPRGRYVGCLRACELGLAFGRDQVVHAALAPGGLTTRVVEEARRLQGLRDGDVGAPAGGKERDSA